MLNFWARQFLVWGAAALTISISYSLYQRFRLKYLRDWFLFVIVFNLGLYVVDLLRTVFPGLGGDAGPAAAQLELVFNALLVRPLIVIGLLLFLRFILGLLDIAVQRRWQWLIAFFMLGHVAGLAVLAARFFSGGGHEAVAVLIVLSDGLVICALYGALAFMQVQAVRHETEPRRQALRNLGIIFFLCQTILVFLPTEKPQLLVGFFLVLPPLLYLWRIQVLLLKGGRRPDASDADLRSFLERFGLTEREQQIVALIYAGRGNRAVSDELFVSIQTVKHHVTAIFRKLKVRNRIQLVNLLSRIGRETEDR